MILTVQPINGRGFPAEAEVSLTEEENGKVYIDLELHPSVNNKKFIEDIDEDWLISGVKDTKYGHFVISSLEKQGDGDYPRIKIRAVASFIHRLQTTTFDGYFTGSRTAVEFFRLLSEQSGLQFTVHDFKEAFGWEKFGEGVHNIREFSRALKNYGYVYEAVSENEIALKNRIGREVNYTIKNAMNADGIKLTIDRSEVYTYVEGYADYEDGEGNFYEQAKLKRTYKSSKYKKLGEKKAETYTNQNINNPVVLDRYLKNIVENSVKFNLTANFYKIKGYPFAVPVLGDRITVQDEAIELDQVAKLIKLVTHYNSSGEVYGYDLEFGSLNIGQRARATIQSVSRQLQDLIDGRGEKLSQTALDASTRAMIEDFKAAQTELIIGDYRDGIMGIFLVERDDPNRAVGLTSKGIVLTENGFSGGIEENLAISPRAINASLIRAGALYLEDILGIEGRNGWLSITGDEFKATSKNDSDKYVSITAEDGVHVNKLPFTQRSPDGRYIYQDGYMRGQIAAGIQSFAPSSVEQDNRNVYYDLPEFERMYVIHDQYWGRYLDLWYVTRLTQSSRSASAHLTVRVTEVGTGTEIYRERTLIRRGAEHEAANFRPRIDLQSFFGVVPDYRKFSFYVEIMFESSYSENKAAYRLNTGWFNG